MHVATIPNRGSPPAILLRESYRKAGKTKNRTLANLSDWPSERIELFRAMLRGDKLAPVGDNGFEIRRSLPHGHVLAALTVARRRRQDADRSRHRDARAAPGIQLAGSRIGSGVDRARFRFRAVSMACVEKAVSSE
jgi:hypothetical protein